MKNEAIEGPRQKRTQEKGKELNRKHKSINQAAFPCVFPYGDQSCISLIETGYIRLHSLVCSHPPSHLRCPHLKRLPLRRLHRCLEAASFPDGVI